MRLHTKLSLGVIIISIAICMCCLVSGLLFSVYLRVGPRTFRQYAVADHPEGRYTLEVNAIDYGKGNGLQMEFNLMDRYCFISNCTRNIQQYPALLCFVDTAQYICQESLNQLSKQDWEKIVKMPSIN